MASNEGLIAGFKNFVLRGNVVDLAVAVVIGAAFKGVVDALLAGLVNPLISALFGKPNLDAVGTFTVNGSNFSVGVVLTALINFLAIAAVVYFLVVRPVNRLLTRFAAGDEPAKAPDPQLVLLGEIRDLLAGAEQD